MVKLIIEPDDGVEPLLSTIRSAKTSLEIAIFRFGRKDVETALKVAAKRGVKVTALIASANRGGEQNLRRLELRFLEAGIIVARTAEDLIRYHSKYILVDRSTLSVLSFNFTHLDIDHSRGFGIVTTRANWVSEAAELFRADCTRTAFEPKTDTFVVSPANSRKLLGAFLSQAKEQLLIYDPKISDKEMLRILQERAKAGVEIRVIGTAAKGASIDARRLSNSRLHTRTIVRDRDHAFIGSQSLRLEELDSRRELGLIIQDPTIVRRLIETFESDWASTNAKIAAALPNERLAPKDEGAAPSEKEVEQAVEVFTKELDPLSLSVKEAVKNAVAKAGEDVLHDEDVKDTMKKVVKKAVKEAVKEAVQEAQEAQEAKSQS